MARRIYDFKCEESHVTEALVDYETTQIHCHCGKEAVRLISPVRVRLDGTDPVYVAAYDRWAKRHEDKQKQEAKQNA